jgi:cytochrome c biogenesis protein CcmG/thiol:disulfide interchange protein DsbE
LLVWSLVNGSGGTKLVEAVRSHEQPEAPGFRLPVLWQHTETWPASLRSAVDDGSVSLRELRGYPIVLNFWASWCVPCKREARTFAAIARSHRGQVVFIGIDAEDTKSAGRRFLSHYDIPYASLSDVGIRTVSAYGLAGLPETFYLDGRGRILRHDIGEVDRGDLARGLAAIMK